MLICVSTAPECGCNVLGSGLVEWQFTLHWQYNYLRTLKVALLVVIQVIKMAGSGMPLTGHQKVGNYICLLLFPLSIYYLFCCFQWNLYWPKGKQPQNQQKRKRLDSF